MHVMARYVLEGFGERTKCDKVRLMSPIGQIGRIGRIGERGKDGSDSVGPVGLG